MVTKHASYPKPSTSTISIILLPLIIFILITLIVYPNESKLQAATSDCTTSAPYADFTERVKVKPDIRLLIGVLTLPGNYERRNLVRLAYGFQPEHSGHVDVKFVFCNVTKEEDIVLVALEIMKYDDIIILDCAENMDGGKTYTYFSSLPKIFDDEPYDYVMKTDDDTYLRLNNLVDTLKRLPRESLYFGLMTPCFGTKADHYMSGMGYVVSWDLVEWISTSDVARSHHTGPEDLITGKWFRDGGKAVHMYDATPAMYDYFQPPHLCYRHEFIPDTVAVHKLKDNLRWVKTLKYFNVTDGLKPSKLYHLP
ncbi:Hexosyltransferase [Rhynchospora pubera]|uniref:Hexosyltransferase n=1 Tax=Rhynchospora pubera TaxID=906938 RepID=A0AAV8FNR7_9POAL|nr:Hexosyltransferase [Rhynchospora pubera]